MLPWLFFFSLFSALADELEEGYEALQAGRYDQALAIFEDEAKKGNRFARFNLGVMYLEGVGVEENPVQAYVWFQLAARQGDSLAAQSATIVLKRMTPAQVVESRNILKEKEKNPLRR